MKDEQRTSPSGLQVNSQHPYLGLESYREEYKEYFFGRGRDTEQLLKLIQRNAVTVLSGKSGLGKTSLIKAGLMPRLRSQDYLPIYLRLNFDDPDTGALALLKSSIEKECRKLDPSLPAFDQQTLWEYFHRVRILNGYVTPVLIFDQFEELFTRGGAHPGELQALITEITDLVENQIPVSVQEQLPERELSFDMESQQYSILFSLREDYLARLETLGVAMPSLKKSRYRIVQMNEEQALEAISQPGKAIISEAESRQILQLLYAVQSENAPASRLAGPKEVEPFLLSLVCYQINELRLQRNESRITDALLQDIQVKNIIEEFYEQSVAPLSKRAQNVLEEQLLTKDGFRKLQPKNDLIQSGVVRESDIEMLIDKRVLRKEIWQGREHVELIHDILVPIIRERQMQWQTERRRRRNLIYAAIVLLSVIFLSSSAWGLYANKQRKLALEGRVEADEQRQLAQSRLVEADEQRQLAESRLVQLEAQSDSLRILTGELSQLLTEAENLRQLALSERDSAQANRLRAEAQELFARTQRQLAETRLAEIQVAQALEKARTIEKLEELKNLPDQEAWRAYNMIGNVATYLWLKEDEASFDTLIQLMQAYEDYIPDDYGLTTPTNPLTYVQDSLDWPLTLVYHPDLRFDWQRFTYSWQSMSESLARSWGIPTPWRIRFEEDDNLPRGQMMIKSPGLENLMFRMPQREGYVLVTKNGLRDDRLWDFFTSHQDEWEYLEEIPYNGPWYLAPKWTQPIFKAGGHSTSPGEGGMALVFANMLLENPAYLLNEGVTKLLLRRVYTSRPETVREAVAARGGIAELTKNLVEVVLWNRSLFHLEYYLDFLANYPGSDPETAAYQMDEASSTNEWLPVALTGVRPATPDDLLEEELSDLPLHRYRESSQSLKPVPSPKIRIYLGPQAMEQFVTEEQQLRPEVLQVLEVVRAELFRQFGLDMPFTKFYPAPELGDAQIRIECLNQDGQLEEAQAFALQEGRYLEGLYDGVHERSIWYRIFWITPDLAAETLDRLPPEISAWLRSRYSVTDLKNIFRSVISPTGEELDLYLDSLYEAALSSIPPENTLFDMEWMLKSLVFWVQTGLDPMEVEGVRQSLIRTQRARLFPESVPSVDQKITATVVEGIRALVDDDLAKAENTFQTAVKKDRAEAMQAFLKEYPGYISQDTSLISSNRIAPGKVESGWDLSNSELRTLEIFLEENEGELEGNELLNGYTTLLHNYLEKEFYDKTDEIIRKIDRLPNPGEWSLSDKYLVGYLYLKNNKRFKSNPRRLPLIEEFLSEAFRGWPAEKLDQIFYEFVEVISKEFQDYDWSARLLERLARQRPENFWLNYRTGNYLAYKSQYDYARAGLDYLDKAERALPAGDADRLGAWVDLARGWAYYTLSGYRNRPERATDIEKGIAVLEPLFAKTAGNPNGFPAQNQVVSSLYGLYVSKNQIEQAAALIDQGLASAPDDAGFLQHKYFTLLAKGDLDSALYVANQLAREDRHYLFQLAMVKVLRNDDDCEYACNRFFDTEHIYRDFIRLWLYYHLAENGQVEHARRMLSARWNDIDPAGWPERLDNGDGGVMREMLLGYYLGEVEENRIYAPLQDQRAFENHPFAKTGPLEGIRCEAYFYKALLHASRQEQQDFVEYLEKTVSTRYYEYYEYQSAQYLLGQLGDRD